MGLIKLVEFHTGEYVYVNPYNIITVQKIVSQYTGLWLVGGQRLFVTQNPEMIQELIKQETGSK